MREIKVIPTCYKGIHYHTIEECSETGENQDIERCLECPAMNPERFGYKDNYFVVLCDYEKKTKKDRILGIIGEYIDDHFSIRDGVVCRTQARSKFADEILAIMDEGK